MKKNKISNKKQQILQMKIYSMTFYTSTRNTGDNSRAN